MGAAMPAVLVAPTSVVMGGPATATTATAAQAAAPAPAAASPQAEARKVQLAKASGGGHGSGATNMGVPRLSSVVGIDGHPAADHQVPGLRGIAFLEHQPLLPKVLKDR